MSDNDDMYRNIHNNIHIEVSQLPNDILLKLSDV